MANAERGELAVTLDGRPFTVKYGLGALAALQEMILRDVGQLLPPDQIIAQATTGRVLFMRAVIWAGLQRYHGSPVDGGDGQAESVRVVEDLIDASTAEEIQRLFAQFGMAMTPDPADVQALGVAASGRPPKGRRRGTGEGSTSTHDVSA